MTFSANLKNECILSKSTYTTFINKQLLKEPQDLEHQQKSPSDKENTCTVSNLARKTCRHIRVYPKDTHIQVQALNASYDAHKKGFEGLVETSINSIKAKRALQAEDQRAIKKAFSSVEHDEKFEKEYGKTVHEIINAVGKELAKVRESGLKVGFGGLKEAGIKKWKFIAIYGDEGKITQLYIGHFKAKGSFTKVYFTLDGRVIKVARADNKGSVSEMLRSEQNISYLYFEYALMTEHSSKMEDLLYALDVPKQDFAQDIQELIQFLPLKPENLMVGERPVMVVPQAICAEIRLKNPPGNVREIIERLGILRDTAIALALLHEVEMVHGDIKPANMLETVNGRGLLDDVGGSRIFKVTDTSEEAAKKYSSLTRSLDYCHYSDLMSGFQLTAKQASVESFFLLGCRADVYALGLSTVEALLGMYDQQGNCMFPFSHKDYKIVRVGDKKLYCVKGDSTQRKEITCIKAISPKIDKYFQMLLDSALNSDHTHRCSSYSFAIALNDVCKALVKIK